MQIHSPFSCAEGIISVASSPLSGRGRVIYLFVLLGGKPAGTSLSVWKCMRVRPLCISTHVCHQITCIKCLGKHKTFMCLLPVLPLGGKSERGRGGLTPSELAHTHRSLSCLLIIRCCSYHSPDSISIWSVSRDASSAAGPAVVRLLCY